MENLIEQVADIVAERIAEKLAAKCQTQPAKLMSVKDVCEQLHLSHSTFYRHKNAGWIKPTCYVGRKPLFDEEAIEQYLSTFD